MIARMSPPQTRRGLIFAAASLAVFTAAVEGTIVATAMPTIVGDLGGLRFFTWVFAVYFLTQAVSIPIYGRLSDLYGRKRVFLAGTAIFLIGSLLCGFARTMPALILFRTLQGIGGGGVQPVATTIVGDLYTPLERAKMQGYLSSVWGVAGVIGPALGAFLVERVSWSAVFWVNVPIALACMGIMLAFLHERAREPGAEVRSRRIDVRGSVLFVLGIGTLIVALVSSVSLAPAALAALGAVAVAALVALVLYERRVPEPMIDLTLYHDRTIAAGGAGTFLIGMLVMTTSAFLPTYLQGVLHGTARLSGIVLGSLSVAWTLGSIVAGRLMIWTTYRATAVIGGVMLVAGAGVLSALDPARGVWWATFGGLLIGLGFGTANSTFLVATQASVGRERRGAATGANLFARQVGQAVGTAVFGAVFNLSVFGYARAEAPTVPSFDAALAPAIALAVNHIFEIGTALAVAILILARALPAGTGASGASAGSKER